MLILYVWTGVHTRVGEGRKREVGGYSRSLFQRTLRSSTLARSAQPADTQGTMTTMTMVTMMSMTNVESLPLSLPVVDTMVKSRGCRFLLSFSCRASSLSIENHSNRSIVRFFRKLAVPVAAVRRQIIVQIFLFSFFSFREDVIDPGIFRQRVAAEFRSFSGTSIGAVSVGGAELAVTSAMDGFSVKKWSEDAEWHFFAEIPVLREIEFENSSERHWSLRSLFLYSLFFFFKFENTFFSRMKFFVRVIEKWFYREREIEIKRLIPIRGKRLIKGIFRRNFEMHFLENGNWHVEISFPRLSTYTFFDEVCRNHTRSNRFWNKVSANGSSLTSMVIYIANTRNFPTGKLLIQMLWNVATSFAPASIARNRRCSGNSSHPANKILSPNSKRNFPRNCDVNACIV